MSELNLIFDEDPELYHRARPGYPAELVDDLLARAQLGQGSRVVEIGPGTGQATRALTARGLHVIAVEPGRNLADLLRRTVTGDVEVVVSTFQDWPGPRRPVDGVVAFTSWHWLPPATRTTLAAAWLRPGGVLATITTHHVAGQTTAVFDDAQACYERWDPATPPGMRVRPPEQVPVTRDEVDDSDAFDPPTHLRHVRDITYTTGEYLDLLRTYSGHRALSPTRRAGLLACLRSLIDSHYDGQVTKTYLYEVRLARRRTPPAPAGRQHAHT